jgi:hypothetical protein
MCKFNRDWADEFDVSGACVFTENQKIEFEKFVDENGDKEVEVYFGTNESWEDQVSDWKRSYSFVEITQRTYEEILNKFPSGLGTFINIMEECDGYHDDEE